DIFAKATNTSDLNDAFTIKKILMMRQVCKITLKTCPSQQMEFITDISKQCFVRNRIKENRWQLSEWCSTRNHTVFTISNG
ncbi:6255_t:CDS:1, partial [Entrophospora sp. SA101]